MLLWLVFRYNTERINSAYAPYHGRFGKTIGNKTDIYWDLYDLDYLVRVVCIEVLPAHSEMLILPMEYLLERKEQWTMELINNDLLVLLKLRKLNDKNVLCVWGIVWGMNINRLVVDCYITHLILILLFNIGGGGRIWTFDLRVMSPTSYLTAPPRF